MDSLTFMQPKHARPNFFDQIGSRHQTAKKAKMVESKPVGASRPPHAGQLPPFRPRASSIPDQEEVTDNAEHWPIWQKKLEH